MNLTGAVAPALQVLTDVGERVAVLGEQQEFAPPVFECGELRFPQTLLQRGQLRVTRQVSHPAGLLAQFFEGVDLSAELL
ncbi:MAG: hypothetical protein ONB06_10250 [candidate division KSB1 bacterium]|nr:hypothetical protein [candidate division KSB1 bacterium]